MKKLNGWNRLGITILIPYYSYILFSCLSELKWLKIRTSTYIMNYTYKGYPNGFREKIYNWEYNIEEIIFYIFLPIILYILFKIIKKITKWIIQGFKEDKKRN